MGLDLAALDLSPQQRLWHQAGLRYVISDPGLRTTGCSEPKSEGAEEAQTALPEPWQALWDRLRPPCPTVWTYVRLADDLQDETSSPERRHLFRNILKALKWPKGSVSFWPCAAQGQRSLEPRPELFWQGMDMLAPRYLFCFGQQALDVICPEHPENVSSFLVGRITVIVLPDPDQMLPDNRALKSRVWNTLTALAQRDPEPFTQE